MPSRRLNDRIRELCSQAATAGDANFVEILSELQTALHEHAGRVSDIALRQIVGLKERRLRKLAEEPYERIATGTD